MKKQEFRNYYLLIIFVFTLKFSAFAQSPKYFIITGKIISEQEISENASVQISMNNKPAVVSQIAANGRFRLELNYNATYQLTFRQNNHIQKTILVNTEIPSDIMQNVENLPHFLMAVKLEKSNIDAEEINSENYIQYINYSSLIKNFTRLPGKYDIEYAENGQGSIRRSARFSDSKSKYQAYQIF